MQTGYRQPQSQVRSWKTTEREVRGWR